MEARPRAFGVQLLHGSVSKSLTALLGRIGEHLLDTVDGPQRQPPQPQSRGTEKAHLTCSHLGLGPYIMPVRRETKSKEKR